jgi:2-polyprenyl-6-methoxyphenol hydroxylase-like FAD-dependent oxidoreductase
MPGIETSVLIVGGGPVGLTLAIDLAWRGVDVTVAELRHAGEPPSVKCNQVSARSMEIFRRLGLAKTLRGLGLPEDFPNDVACVTAVSGMELSRIPIPSRRDRYTAKDGPDGWWPTPEPPHRINQIYLEPALFAYASTHPRIRILSRTSVEGFEQRGDGVVARASALDGGDQTSIACRYLVGCDGARSTVRHEIGATFEGTPVLSHVQSTYIRAPKLRERINGRPAWLYLAFNPRRCGTVMAVDGHERWLVHNWFYRGETDFDSVDRHEALCNILGVETDFAYEVLSTEDWTARRLVADKFAEGRVFLCGDAAHLWVPHAGYGMNAGIADAADLAWMLAAVLKGWGAPGMLAAYQAERQPITDQVSHFAMGMAGKNSQQRRDVPAEIEASGPEGEAARARVGREAYELYVQQQCCGGLNFGYFYDRSPIIAYDGEAQPGYTMGAFTPSTVPGCRAPHLWLAGDRSLYDALGADYTLVRSNPAADPSPLLRAATERGVPLKMVDLDAGDRTPYERPLTLVRPDQHVAWRGAAAPERPHELIDLVRGAVANAA